MFKVMKIILFVIIMVNIGNLAYAGEKHGPVRVDNLEIDLWVNKSEGSTYYYGEDLAIYLRTNDDCYVVVYDIDPEGNVSLLFPSDYESSCFVRGGEVVRIPDVYDDYHLEIAGPRGEEHIYAVATYKPITPPDFIRYEYFEYGNWDSYYDDFVHSMVGERAKFATDLNWRIAQGDHASAHTMFYIDDGYRHHRWYRHWTYDPYYVGSVWVGTGYPGCEVWIDGVYWGIAPILIPQIYVGRHWVWIYYNGYPCWQDYIYVTRGQRYYVDVKIGRRYLDFEYGRGNMRDWRFKYEVHENEQGFVKKAREARVKHTPPRRPAPVRVVEKYSKIEASNSQAIKNRSTGNTPRNSSSKTTTSTQRQKTADRFKVYEPKRDYDYNDRETKTHNKFDDSKIEKKSLNSKSGSTIIKNRSTKDNDEYKRSTPSNRKTPSVRSKSSGVSKPKSPSISQPKSSPKPSPKSSGSSKSSRSSSSDKESKGKRGKK